MSSLLAAELRAELAYLLSESSQRELSAAETATLRAFNATVSVKVTAKATPINVSRYVDASAPRG